MISRAFDQWTPRSASWTVDRRPLLPDSQDWKETLRPRADARDAAAPSPSPSFQSSTTSQLRSLCAINSRAFSSSTTTRLSCVQTLFIECFIYHSVPLRELLARFASPQKVPVFPIAYSFASDCSGLDRSRSHCLVAGRHIRTSSAASVMRKTTPMQPRSSGTASGPRCPTTSTSIVPSRNF